MRLQRSIRNRSARKKIPALDLDITSLLDILVIMLVFLLQSYNTSDVVINVPPGIKLPISESSQTNTVGTLLQASKDKIWVDDQVVVDLASPPPVLYDQGNRRIIPLYNELIKKKEMIRRIQLATEKAKPFSGRVNLVIDKEVRYNDLKRIMYTCAEAGFQQYKFVVMGKEQF